MELATAIIWTLRIVLPIILFCIYFKLQSAKEGGEQPASYPGPADKCYSRGKLLAHRKATLGLPAPSEFSDFCWKDESQAPQLFAARPPRGKGKGRGKGKDVDGDHERPQKPRESRDPQKRRERRSEDKEGDDAPAEEDGAPRPRAPKRGATQAPKTVEEEPERPAEKEEEPPSGEVEKMHLESLLNYVAFNRKEQQRTFLLDEEAAPPPPPPKKKPVAAAAAASAQGGGASTSKLEIEGVTAEKANAEAQMVLKGAIKFKRSGVAQNLYEQLQDSQVELSQKTFTLMIESCVGAQDLKSASDFLMKMETSGYSPDSGLLDKVMDLYAFQKAQKEQMEAQARQPLLEAKVGRSEDAGLLDEAMLVGGATLCDDVTMQILGERAKLSSSARLFVPNYIPAAPPPAPPPMQQPVPGQAVESGEGVPQAPVEDAPAAPRTRLTAQAKPFEPQLNLVFDPNMYTWTVQDGGKGEGGKQGSKKSGRGKGKDGGAKGDKKAKKAEDSNTSSNDATEAAAPKPKAKAKAKPKAKAKANSAEYSENQGGEASKGAAKWVPK